MEDEDISAIVGSLGIAALATTLLMRYVMPVQLDGKGIVVASLTFAACFLTTMLVVAVVKK